MDFYAHQDKARRLSSGLLLLFVSGLLCLSLLIGLLLAGALLYAENQGQPLLLSPLMLLSPRLVLGITLAISVLILLVSLFKYLSLAQGGRRVAEALGGRPILPETRDLAERRLRNLVEEMAIAAGLPVPPVYLLDEEPGINAFAAGLTINDAVVAVTRGALEQLDRDELQGVIGHEFSHILNGDMRLNLRLTAALAGLLFIGQLGRLLLSSRRGPAVRVRRGNGKGAGLILLLGLGLLLLGYVGILWSRLVQAALNRQREFLADASAVQFTRYPQGLASALKKIGGHRYASLMFHPASETFSHLFFGQGLSTRFAGLFASHPPLAERIRRLDPDWDGRYLSNGPSPAEQRSSRLQDAAGSALLLPTHTPTGAANPAPASELATPEVWLPLIPVELANAARSTFAARHLLFALLLESEPALRQRQLELLGDEAIEVVRLAEVPVPAGLRLALLELAMPALKQMSAPQYRGFRDQLVRLMQADQRISLAEWILYRVLQHQLGSQYARRVETPVRFRQLEQVADAVQTLLSCLAHLSAPEQAERVFGRGANCMALYGIRLQADPPVAALGPALGALEQATAEVRLRFLRGVVQAIEHDGKISAMESELFRALAVCLECPVPPPRSRRSPETATPA